MEWGKVRDWIRNVCLVVLGVSALACWTGPTWAAAGHYQSTGSGCSGAFRDTFNLAGGDCTPTVDSLCSTHATTTITGGRYTEFQRFASGACQSQHVKVFSCDVGYKYDGAGACSVASEVECGEGTHEDGGICVPDSVLECGEGTHEDGGICVADVECGEGTHDEGGSCVTDTECPDSTWVYDVETSLCLPSEFEMGDVNVEGLEVELVALGLVICAVLGFIASRLR